MFLSPRTRACILVLLAVGLAACKHDSGGDGVETMAQGRWPIIPHAGDEYKARLLATIAKADRIVVNEHSYAFDGVDMRYDGTNTPQPKPVVIYKEVTMTAAQKQRFGSAVSAMPAATTGAVPACIFEGRHTIQFYVKDKLDSALDICFHCGQLEWKGNDNLLFPDAMVGTLKTVIEDMGLTPARDWDRYAIERATERHHQ